MTPTAVDLARLTVAPLSGETWDAFAGLAERHNGVWGGCWCTYFHTMHDEKTFTADGNRSLKQQRVADGRAHAALVMDGDEALAWCEFGSPDELPNINHLKQYLAETEDLPDYRITCFFVDKRFRRQGLSAMALRGALQLIGEAGGGVVESYPEDTTEPKKTASHLYNGVRRMFEAEGFDYLRPKGMKHCVMRIVVPASGARDAETGTAIRRHT